MSRRKTVLVTGCSAGGLGAALAQAFQEAGCHVFATARNPSKIPDSLTSLPHVEVLALDVTSTESISSCVSEIKTRTENRLDVLVNNAGGGILMPLLDTPIEEAKGVFDVNFWGVIATVKACAPLLINARGVVVNISSIGGALALPWQGMYIFLKHCLHRIHLSSIHLYRSRSCPFLSSCLLSAHLPTTSPNV
jgi:1-acylglycerone phosphate reductase